MVTYTSTIREGAGWVFDDFKKPLLRCDNGIALIFVVVVFKIPCRKKGRSIYGWNTVISDDTGIVKGRVRIQTHLPKLKTHVCSLRMLSIPCARKWERCWWPASAFSVYNGLCKFSLVLTEGGESEQELGVRPTGSMAPFPAFLFVEIFILDSEWGFLS